MGGPGRGLEDLRADRRRGPLGRRQDARRADDPELGRADQGDHPLGEQPIHRGDHRRGEAGARRGFLGLPDARRDVRRRDGVFRRPSPQRKLPRRGRRDHEAGQGHARRRPALRDGAGRLRLPDQPPRDLRRAGRRRRRHDAAEVLHAPGPPDDRRRNGLARHAPQGGRRPLRQPVPSHDRAAPRLPDDDQQPLPRLPRRGGPRLGPLGPRGRADPPGERLRPRPARTAPRRPPTRPDRPGSQPTAGRRGHPRRRG